MDKRGISMIVSTLLIVLLVIVIMGLVWGVVRGFVQESSEDVGLTQFTTSVNIQDAVIEGNSISVNIIRNSGEGDLTGIAFIFSDGKNSEVQEIIIPLKELERRNFNFILNKLNILEVEMVSIAPIFKSGSGKDTTGRIIHTYNIKVGESGEIQTTPNLKVAFIGDQGLGPAPISVLNLIKNEGAEMVIHSGDFDYGDDPSSWDDQITSILGPGFPYFSSVGNHDVPAWSGSSGYQKKIIDRIARVSDASCSGDIGVKSSCTYKGLFFILSGIGTLGSDHESYIASELQNSQAVWNICSWHKNQQKMQVGGKLNEVGWSAYEICKGYGALIMTSHEHSYSRTHVLNDIENQVVADSTSPYLVGLNQTIVVVSGLGGHSLRDQERCLPSTKPYGCNGEWASIYTSNQNANYGALFCTFHIDNDPQKARCYFKDVAGEIVDDYIIMKGVVA